MKPTVRLALVVVPIVASVMPVFWMAVLAVVQSGNLRLDPPYWHEFLYILAFWVGFVAAVWFARKCLLLGRRWRIPWVLWLLIFVGIVGAISEEIHLMHNAKMAFPLGFFVVAPVSWVVAGIIARMMPNQSFKRDALKRAP